ncbi:MAG: glutaredoxin family protein [Okeania sp. SIO2H7]|nr:glutaredoxin family protein [Okeania sp. SIO2H7]
MKLILYTKPGCHLCEGLQEKLEQIQNDPESSCKFDLELRDITTREEWFLAYEYEVPVLFAAEETTTNGSKRQAEKPIPRPSPRIGVKKLEQMLQQYL